MKALVDGYARIQGTSGGRSEEPRAVQGNPFLPKYRSPLVPRDADDDAAKRNKIAASNGAAPQTQQELQPLQQSPDANSHFQPVDVHP